MQVAVSIGNFDGVHLGHERLVAAAREAVGAAGTVHVLVFDPHPLSVLRPGRAPGRLTTAARREALLREAGADEVTPLRPTDELLGQEPAEFVADLVERLHPSFIIEGPDFHFGRRRAGTVATLTELEGAGGYRTVVIDPVSAPLANQHVVPVSSTMVRWLLARGRVADAARLLGRPYELRCPVVSGERRGRALGVPTANLAPDDLQLPADGIYAGRAARAGGRWFPAAISVGTKPTFGHRPRTCEAHLVGYDGPLDDYGWEIHLAFGGWIRDQVRYPDATALREQLGRDLAAAAAAPGLATIARTGTT